MRGRTNGRTEWHTGYTWVHAAETSAAVAQLSGAASALLCRHDYDLWTRVDDFEINYALDKTCAAES